MFFGPLTADAISYFVPLSTTIDTAAQRFSTAHNLQLGNRFVDDAIEPDDSTIVSACLLGDDSHKQGHPIKQIQYGN